MKRIITALLLLTLGLSACSSSPASPGAEPQQASSESAPSTGGQAEAAREAVVSEILNSVSARSTSSDEFAEALAGMKLLPGGGLQTGEAGKARLDLAPEGTIIRVAPNSSFTMQSMDAGVEPKTTLRLLFGKVFILLRGGSLEVETPSGIAAVRGSLLSVQYSQKLNRLRASCLEGTCTLQNQAGNEVELTKGQSAFIDEDGNLSDAREIDRDEIEAWLNENPDLLDFLDELPDPADYPDYDDDAWFYSSEDMPEEDNDDTGE